MIDLTGKFIKEYKRYSLANAWANKDVYRAEAHELCIVHALCVINLDSGAETVSSIIGVLDAGLLYYHTSKLAYGINVSHVIVTPIVFREGERLRVQLYASAADTPVVVAFRGMSYDLKQRKET